MTASQTHRRWWRARRVAAIWAILAAGTASGLAASSAGDDPSRVQVVLIGIDDEAAPAIDRLTSVLKRDSDPRRVLRFVPNGEDHPPTLEALRRHAARALQNLSATDRAIVYYRGNLLEDAGKFYLVVSGTDPKNLAATALPLEELRTWLDEDDGDSEALLLIEAPEASRVADAPGARHYVLGCGEGEDFAARLAEGFAGAADANGDATITLAELKANLQSSPGRSKPVIADPPSRRDAGMEDLVTLVPRALPDAFRELATWADAEARRASASRVEVRPFGFNGAIDTTRASVSLAGKLATALQQQASTAYYVEGPPIRPVRSVNLAGAPAKASSSHVLQGTYQKLSNPDRLLVQAKLGHAGGRVLGQSTRVILVDDHVRSQIFGEPVDGSPSNSDYLKSEGRAVDVALFVEGQPQPLPFEDDGVGGLKVRVPKNKKYWIDVKNLTERRLAARLVIDGVNTVVQKDQDADVSPCLLGDARAYVLEPNVKFAFREWILKVGQDGDVAAFQFVPEDQSKASAIGAGGKEGMILLAFYPEADRMLAFKGAKPTYALGTGAAAVVHRRVDVAQEPMQIHLKPVVVLKIAYECDDQP